MRFTKDGPDIPGELLDARDAGEVVFLCGAGVSMARAGLPGFHALTEKVLEGLHVVESHPVRRHFMDASGQALPGGASIAYDQVFDVLEEDFSSADIDRIVARILKPKKKLSVGDLSAHETVRALATSSLGQTKIVTTNFDLLFSGLDDPPPRKLASEMRAEELSAEFHGVVHLHGAVTDAYDGSRGDLPFVLSGAEFGSAYMYQGWATEWLRKLFADYFVVLLGYEAEDAPVRFLLRGLTRHMSEIRGIYAVDAGKVDERKWKSKNVTPLVAVDFDELWDSLDVWMSYTNNGHPWQVEAASIGLRNPSSLEPFERGQVAAAVSTEIGARRFAQLEPIPDVSWLRVFDRQTRLTENRADYTLEKEERLVVATEPNDSNHLLAQLNRHASTKKNQVTSGWDAFVNPKGTIFTDDTRVPSDAEMLEELADSKRAVALLCWLARLAGSVEVIRWAASKNERLAVISDHVRPLLNSNPEHYQPEAYGIWEQLLESVESQRTRGEFDLYLMSERLTKRQISERTIRELVRAISPVLKVQAVMVTEENDLELRWFVDYPLMDDDFEIPECWLEYLLKLLSHAIEQGERWVNELAADTFFYLPPLFFHAKRWVNSSPSRAESYFKFFLDQYCKLAKADQVAATKLFHQWDNSDLWFFIRLRLALLRWGTLTDDDALLEGSVTKLDAARFWSDEHRYAQVEMLRTRWNSLSTNSRKKVETLIFDHPPFIDSEGCRQQSIEARRMLDCYNAFQKADCTFNNASDARAAELQSSLPSWRPSDQPWGSSGISMGGMVEIDESTEGLEDVCTANLIEECRRRRDSETHFLQRKTPFLGISRRQPKRALDALLLSLDEGKESEKGCEDEWRIFFQRDKPESEEKKDTDVEALDLEDIERVLRNGPAIVSQMTRPTLHTFLFWIKNRLREFTESHPNELVAMLSAVVDFVESADKDLDEKQRKKHPELSFYTDAIDRCEGLVTEALIQSWSTLRFMKCTADLQSSVRDLLARLLSLESIPLYWSVSVASSYGPYLFDADADWTRANFKRLFQKNDSKVKTAFWEGYRYQCGQQPTREWWMETKSQFFDDVEIGLPLTSPVRHEFARYLTKEWAFGKSVEETPVEDSELRALLRAWPEETSIAIPSAFKSMISDEKCLKEHVSNRALIAQFLRFEWPRDSNLKSERMRAELVHLALANTQVFSELSGPILELVSPADFHPKRRWFRAYEVEKELIRDFAKTDAQALIKLLNIVVPRELYSDRSFFEEAISECVKCDRAVIRMSEYRRLRETLSRDR